MPRTPEQNARVRKTRRAQILDAALTVYVRYGFYGTDMDAVAEQAELAKGLIYYYFKTKRDLFAALYTWMIDAGYAFTDDLLAQSAHAGPVEQLARYAYGVFAANKENPRMVRFFMRLPFDAVAVFGPDVWKEGAEKSDMHRRALAGIIGRGMAEGIIPLADPDRAANSFWTVFVANLFEYSRMMTGAGEAPGDPGEALREAARFCFQGLGVDEALWGECLHKVVAENTEGAQSNESIPE